MKKSFMDDEFESFRQYKEYQRLKDEAVVRGLGSFLYSYLIYAFIYICTYLALSVALIYLFELNSTLAMILSMLLAFLIFKIKYVRHNKLRSLVSLVFIIVLEYIAFSS